MKIKSMRMCLYYVYKLLIYRNFARQCPLPVPTDRFDDSHIKTHILFQAHLSRLQLPHSDYVTDTKSVMDQAIRILQVRLFFRGEFTFVLHRQCWTRVLKWDGCRQR
jgi:hypothetical protein